MIVSESERLSRLINTVLDFSKIDQGNKRYDLQPTNLSAVLQAVIGVMEKTMNEKGFDLKTDIAPNVQTVADAADLPPVRTKAYFRKILPGTHWP